MAYTEQKYELSAKALENLKRNEFLRRFEWGLEPIPELEYSNYAYFDAEKIQTRKEKKEIDGKTILTFSFIYLIGIDVPESEIGIRKLVVNSKTSAQIDAYLSEGTNVLDIKIVRTPTGIKYKVKPFEPVKSVPDYSTPLPAHFYEQSPL